MTNLAGSHTSIDRFLAAGKINTVAFVHFSFPLAALIMKLPAVAVTDISCRIDRAMINAKVIVINFFIKDHSHILMLHLF